MSNKVDILRAKLSLACISYQKILIVVGSNPEKSILLFEGEDEKYYAGRIPHSINYTGIFCDGISKVIEAFSLTKKNKILESIKLYAFIDRDYDEIVHNEDVYVTKSHSIENLYCSSGSFVRFVRAELGITQEIDAEKFQIIYDNYYERFIKQLKDIKILSSWFRFQRDKEKTVPGTAKVNANKININEFIKLNGKGVMMYLRQRCPRAHKWTRNEKEKFVNMDDIHVNMLYNYRGKWVMELYKTIVNSLINDAKKNTLSFKVHRFPELIIQSNGLSALSQYADTPECLVNFLKKISA